MKNNLKDLNDYLFEELERLNDDDNLKKNENFDKEIKRSKAISEVANQIVQNAKVVLDAKKHSDSWGDKLDDFYKIKTEKKKNDPYLEFSNNLK